MSIIHKTSPCHNIYSVKPEDIDLSKATIKRYSCFSPGDRATTINLDDSSEYALIETYQKVWIKYLLNHDYAEILKIWVIDDGNKKNIVGLYAKIPVNCVRLSRKPRKRFDKM